jgi:glycosyltransferase involved in cell wall biosynthesis
LEVVLVHPADPSFPIQGGSIRYILSLLDFLSKNNINVTLIGAKYLKKDRTFSSSFTFVPIDGYASSRSWQFFLLGLFTKLPRLRLPKDAIIHTCRLEYMIPFMIIYPTNPKVITLDKQTVTFRIHHPRLFRIFWPVLYASVKIVLNHIDRVITDKKTYLFYRNIFPQIVHKCVISTTSFVDLDKFKPIKKDFVRKKYGIGPSEKVVIFVGRVEKVKNMEFLIRSFSFVQKKYPNSRLMILGSGDKKYCRELQKFINDLNLMNNVKFIGEKIHDEIPQILNCADVLVLCSRTEGSPTVIREALACGIPVVTTAVGDVSHILINETIGKISQEDEEKFAEDIVSFFTDTESAKLERRRLIKILGLDLESQGRKILSLYSELYRIKAC